MTTAEEKQAFLEMYLIARRKEFRMRRRIDQIRIELGAPGRKPLDGMPYAKGNKKDLSDLFVVIDKATTKMLQQKAEADALRTIVIEAIDQIEKKNLKHVLKQKYIRGLKIKQIAENMGKTSSRVSQIHTEALKAFEVPALSNPQARALADKYMCIG